MRNDKICLPNYSPETTWPDARIVTKFFQNYLIRLHLPFCQKLGTTNLDGTDLINSFDSNNRVRWQ